MRTVRPRPLREYFRISDSDPGIPRFYRQRHLINRMTMTLSLLLIAAFMALGGRCGRILFFSMLVFLVGLYLRTRKVAEGIRLKRKVPRQAIEKKNLSVQVEIANGSSFDLNDLYYRDRFSGCRKTEIIRAIGSRILPESIHREAFEVPCDAGMGMHSFGPLVAVVTDALGIFEFTITEDERQWVEVLPEFIPLQEFRIPASLESSVSGLNESPVKGASVNFHGIREYVHGDPLRQIHWKLSARHQQLIVKELESTINTDLTLVADMDPANHIGFKDTSTWEYVKDIAISLIQEKLAGANRIQLIAQGLEIPFGRGANHRQLMIHRISKLALAGKRSERPVLLERFERIPYGSTVIFVGPFYQADSQSFLHAVQALQRNGVQVKAIFIDSASFIPPIHSVLVSSHVLQRSSIARKTFDRLLSDLAELDVPVHVVAREQSIPARLRIELRGKE